MMQICHRKEFAQECSKADFSSIIPSFVYVWNVSFASTFYYLLFWFDFINRSFFNYYYSRSIGSGTSKTSSLPLVSDNSTIAIRTMVTRNTVVDRIFVKFGKTSALLRSLQYLYASLVCGPRKITVP